MSADEIGLAVFQIKKGKNIAVQSETAANIDRIYNTENQVMDEVMNDQELEMNEEETINNEGK